MLGRQTRSFRLRFLGVCVFLLASVFLLIPKKYQPSLSRLFPSGESSRQKELLDTKTDRSADLLRRKNARSQHRDPKEWFAEVRARNPELEPEWRVIPDHENGFLQWLELCEKYRVEGVVGSETLDLPEHIDDMLSEPEKWDSQAMKAFLDANKDLLEAITRIGLLPSQSANGIDVDRWSFVGGQFNRQCNQLLLADARLAVEAGDLNDALSRIQAASGLANHLDQVESPSLLMTTISTVNRRELQEQTLKHILPALSGNTADITRLREAIRTPDMKPSAFASTLRGEGWVGLGGLVIPLVNASASSSSEQNRITDPDALFDTLARTYTAAADRAQALSLSELMDAEDPFFGLPVVVDHLSKESRSILDVNGSGVRNWRDGWIRSIVLSARTDAALAVMQGHEIPLEPLTGLSYIYDPVTRTLQVPNDSRFSDEKLKIGAPIQLPIPPLYE